MLKVIFITIIIGITIRASQANISKESECREKLEDELREYVKLDVWQELFKRRLKFIVTENGKILSERKQLKFNTIMHNAIYGCDHDRDDEVDDCPNIYRGSIKSCNHGRNLRSAMFRVARCVFVESTIKHMVLSDALLDAFPSDKLDKLYDHVDRPIREFGETVANMLSTLAYGETGGLGELMAVNLYLNNGFKTVLMHRVPVGPVTSATDFHVAAERMRHVHKTVLGELRAFRDTWCGDEDVAAQCRAGYERAPLAVVLDEMKENADDADGLLRGLNVSGPAAGVDPDPRGLALADYVRAVASSGSMPGPMSADLRLRSFEASYQFDPVQVRRYHAAVFRHVYACFYWATVVHLKLADRVADGVRHARRPDLGGFAVGFVRYARPLTAFDVNRHAFATSLPPEASANLTELLLFMARIRRGAKNADRTLTVLAGSTDIRKFIDLLSADMANMCDMDVPDAYFDGLSPENALSLMRSNYKAFARLVAATSGSKEDRINVIKMKKFFYFVSEAVDFENN